METTEAMETCSGELLLRRAAVELEGEGFGGSWTGRRCQQGARGTGGSGGVAWKGRACSPAAEVAVNRGGGSEMRLATAVAMVGVV